MGKIEGMKERCYWFSVQLVRFLKRHDSGGFYKPLINQALRSGTSIGANVIEAKSASSTRDFLNYYQIALKSGNETKYWLSLLRDSVDSPVPGLPELLQETTELVNILAASVVTLKAKLRKKS